MMEVTIHVPIDIAARWQAQGDIPRAVLEGAPSKPTGSGSLASPDYDSG